MAKPKPSFEDALGDLLAQYADEPLDDLISAMELQLEALRDDERNQKR